MQLVPAEFAVMSYTLTPELQTRFIEFIRSKDSERTTYEIVGHALVAHLNYDQEEGTIANASTIEPLIRFKGKVTPASQVACDLPQGTWHWRIIPHVND